MGWRINWDKLSNDALLEFWLRPKSENRQSTDEIEKILKDRGVITVRGKR